MTLLEEMPSPPGLPEPDYDVSPAAPSVILSTSLLNLCDQPKNEGGVECGCHAFIKATYNISASTSTRDLQTNNYFKITTIKT